MGVTRRRRLPKPLASDLVRVEWLRRVEAEYRSAAITQQLALWLIQIGASPDLIRAGLRIVSDELTHSEMSHRVYAAARGRYRFVGRRVGPHAGVAVRRSTPPNARTRLGTEVRQARNRREGGVAGTGLKFTRQVRKSRQGQRMRRADRPRARCDPGFRTRCRGLAGCRERTRAR